MILVFFFCLLFLSQNVIQKIDDQKRKIERKKKRILLPELIASVVYSSICGFVLPIRYNHQKPNGNTKYTPTYVIDHGNWITD